TGIQYRASALSQSLQHMPKHAPQAGDRFPWLKLKRQGASGVEDLFRTVDDTRFNLYVFGQRAPAADTLPFGDLTRVHEFPSDAENDAGLRRVSIPTTSFYLVRPDGYIGLCGPRFDLAAVKRYFSDRLLMTRS